MADRCSDLLNASALILGRSCKLKGVSINTDGSHDAVLTIYDGLTATGKVSAKITVLAADKHGKVDFNVEMNNGIYVSLSGTGATYNCYYEL